MKRIRFFFIPCLIVLAGLILLSPPAAGQEKEKKEKKEPQRQRAQRTRQRRNTLDPELRKYLDSIAKFIASPNPKVRDSVKQTFLAVGKDAIAVLRRVMNRGSEEAKKEASKLLAELGDPRALEGKNQVEAMAKQLGLNEEQKKKLEPVLTGYREKQKALVEKMRSGDLDREDFIEKRKALQEEREAQLQDVLTEEQYDKYKEEAKKSRRRGLGGGRRKKKDDGGGGR